MQAQNKMCSIEQVSLEKMLPTACRRGRAGKVQ